MKKFPYQEVEFTKSGKVFKADMVQEVIHMISQKKITDLLVVSHGWNNDKKEARELYQKLLKSISQHIERSTAQNGKIFGVMAILWPSKKFAEDELIPGGAASLSGKKTSKAKLMKRLKGLQSGFDGTRSDAFLAKAEAAVTKMEKDADEGAKQFIAQMEKLVAGIRSISPEPEDHEAIVFKEHQAKSLLLRLYDTENEIAQVSKSARRGGAATTTAAGHKKSAQISGGATGGIGGLFTGIFDGARNLLNFVTYYQMKARAGNVGELGLMPALRKIRKAHPEVKLHLIGHSFGGRLVTAATAFMSGGMVDTLVLLQAAFSHYGFARKYDGKSDGHYRSAILNVNGPILISHTQNDKAVGLAYAIASRIARQTGSFLGANNDLYGGMGANGAQSTPEATADFPMNPNAQYKFAKGKIYNMISDGCIKDHSDICGEEVGRAIAAAIK